MTKTNRFAFPGFEFIRNQDTETHEVEIGQIKVGDDTVILHLLRNAQFENLPFVLSLIEKSNDTRLWSFKDEGFSGIGRLAMAGDKPALALIERGPKGRVVRAVLLSEIVSGSRSQDVLANLTTKKATAENLGRGFVLTEIEQQLTTLLARRASDATAAKLAGEAEKRAAEYAAREVARKARMQEILARPVVEGFIVSGQKRRGIPVVGVEWKTLPDGTFVITTASYDELAHSAGELRDSFKVKKIPGRDPQMEFKALITSLTQPTATTGSHADLPQPIKHTLYENKDGAFIELPVYGSMDQIRVLQKNGLNGGSLVGVPQKDTKGGLPKIGVYAVHHDEIKTIGEAPLL